MPAGVCFTALRMPGKLENDMPRLKNCQSKSGKIGGRKAGEAVQGGRPDGLGLSGGDVAARAMWAVGDEMVREPVSSRTLANRFRQEWREALDGRHAAEIGHMLAASGDLSSSNRPSTLSVARATDVTNAARNSVVSRLMSTSSGLSLQAR